MEERVPFGAYHEDIDRARFPVAALLLPEGVTALDLADEEIWRVVGLLSHGDSVPSPVAFGFCQFVLDELPKLAQTSGLQVESG